MTQDTKRQRKIRQSTMQKKKSSNSPQMVTTSITSPGNFQFFWSSMFGLRWQEGANTHRRSQCTFEQRGAIPRVLMTTDCSHRILWLKATQASWTSPEKKMKKKAKWWTNSKRVDVVWPLSFSSKEKVHAHTQDSTLKKRDGRTGYGKPFLAMIWTPP